MKEAIAHFSQATVDCKQTEGYSIPDIKDWPRWTACMIFIFLKKIHQLQIKFKSWNLINEREDEQISLDSGEDVQEGGLSFPG